MKLQITSHIFFLPYWNYLPRKINPKFFQILLNYETNRSHVNRCIYSTDIYPSIYIHNQPRNIRHRDKNEGKGGGKKRKGKKEKGMERKGADLRFRSVPLRSSICRRGTRARIRQLFIILFATIVAKLGNLCVFWYSRLRFISFFHPPFSSTGIAEILDREAG